MQTEFITEGLNPKDIMPADKLARVIMGEEPLYVASCGLGLDSTAMAVAMVEKIINYPLDFVMFADTGSELPETYAALAFYKKWFEDRNVPFVVVKNAYGKSLEQYCRDKNIVPSRMRRDCTGKFKISPMRRYLRETFGKKAKFVKYIGYNADEAVPKKEGKLSRVEKAKKSKNPSYETCRYPMVEQGIGRAAEAELLKKLNLPVPQKSGCSFCPFTRKAGWVWLHKEHPDLFESAMSLEENSNEFKNKAFTLSSRPLRMIKADIESGKIPLTIVQDAEGKFHCGRDMGDK